MKTFGKATMGAAAASLLWAGAALAQGGTSGTGGIVGGPSNGQPSDPRNSTTRPDSGNTPITGGGATTQTGKATPSKSDRMTKSDEVIGKVEKVDQKNHTLRVEGHSGQLQLDSSTDVMKDGVRASAADIHEGDRVRASFSEGESKLKRLEVMSPPAGTDTSPGSGQARDSKMRHPSKQSGASSASPGSSSDSAASSSDSKSK